MISTILTSLAYHYISHPDVVVDTIGRMVWQSLVRKIYTIQRTTPNASIHIPLTLNFAGLPMYVYKSKIEYVKGVHDRYVFPETSEYTYISTTTVPNLYSSWMLSLQKRSVQQVVYPFSTFVELYNIITSEILVKETLGNFTTTYFKVTQQGDNSLWYFSQYLASKNEFELFILDLSESENTETYIKLVELHFEKDLPKIVVCIGVDRITRLRLANALIRYNMMHSMKRTLTVLFSIDTDVVDYIPFAFSDPSKEEIATFLRETFGYREVVDRSMSISQLYDTLKTYGYDVNSLINLPLAQHIPKVRNKTLHVWNNPCQVCGYAAWGCKCLLLCSKCTRPPDDCVCVKCERCQEIECSCSVCKDCKIHRSLCMCVCGNCHRIIKDCSCREKCVTSWCYGCNVLIEDCMCKRCAHCGHHHYSEECTAGAAWRSCYCKYCGRIWGMCRGVSVERCNRSLLYGKVE